MTDNGQVLAVLEGEIVSPRVTPEAARAAMQQYQEMLRALTDKSDYQSFEEDGKIKTFPKKSAAIKLGVPYGITLEERSERVWHKHDPAICMRLRVWQAGAAAAQIFPDCNCAIEGVRWVVRAIHSSGRFVDEVGIATRNEKRVKYVRPEHDLSTKAYTRASNRAIFRLVGATIASAEEKVAEAKSLSREDKAAIAEAWRAADAERRAHTLEQMRSWGWTGESARDLFTDFNGHAEAEDVQQLLTYLQTGSEATPFDPETVADEPASQTIRASGVVGDP